MSHILVFPEHRNETKSFWQGYNHQIREAFSIAARLPKTMCTQYLKVKLHDRVMRGGVVVIIHILHLAVNEVTHICFVWRGI